MLPPCPYPMRGRNWQYEVLGRSLLRNVNSVCRRCDGWLLWSPMVQAYVRIDPQEALILLRAERARKAQLRKDYEAAQETSNACARYCREQEADWRRRGDNAMADDWASSAEIWEAPIHEG